MYYSYLHLEQWLLSIRSYTCVQQAEYICGSPNVVARYLALAVSVQGVASLV